MTTTTMTTRDAKKMKTKTTRVRAKLFHFPYWIESKLVALKDVPVTCTIATRASERKRVREHNKGITKQWHCALIVTFKYVLNAVAIETRQPAKHWYVVCVFPFIQYRIHSVSCYMHRLVTLQYNIILSNNSSNATTTKKKTRKKGINVKHFACSVSANALHHLPTESSSICSVFYPYVVVQPCRVRCRRRV